MKPRPKVLSGKLSSIKWKDNGRHRTFSSTKDFLDYLKSFDSTPLQKARRRERERTALSLHIARYHARHEEEGEVE